MRKATDYVPPLRGGVGNKKFAVVGNAHDLHLYAQSLEVLFPTFGGGVVIVAGIYTVISI
jgi:hypothetical protein